MKKLLPSLILFMMLPLIKTDLHTQKRKNQLSNRLIMYIKQPESQCSSDIYTKYTKTGNIIINSWT